MTGAHSHPPLKACGAQTCVKRFAWDRRSLVALALLALTPPAAAHEFKFTEAVAILRNTGAYEIEVTVDVDALALGVPPSADSKLVYDAIRAMPPGELAAASERARQVLIKWVRIEFDGGEQVPWVSFPDEGRPIRPDALPTYFGITARFSGFLPPRAQEFTFGASRAMGPVHLTIFDQTTGNVVKYILGVSEDSPPYAISSRPGAATTSLGSLDTAGRYLMLGFTHILPKGLDHILFVLGLFLLSTKWRPLLWQITAFTVAHTATLGLSVLGVLSLPSRIVEPLIALSIAYVAIENIFTEKMGPWRPALVFSFGLLHGLGFAGVLRELGLPDGELVAALLSFNVGVELGQIAVVLLSFAAVGWARKFEWYRGAIVKPISAAIAVTGLYWTLERALGA